MSLSAKVPFPGLYQLGLGGIYLQCLLEEIIFSSLFVHGILVISINKEIAGSFSQGQKNQGASLGASC